jgi:hypothetical protein
MKIKHKAPAPLPFHPLANPFELAPTMPNIASILAMGVVRQKERKEQLAKRTEQSVHTD